MKVTNGYIISYAQNKEDLIIDAFFPDVKKGFYVDVGANDPEDDSVTKLFYDKGWSGINIEPNATLYQKLSRARKRDINLPYGVSDRTGEIEFREYTNHGLSTFSENAKKQNRKSNDPQLLSYKDYKAKVLTLNNIFESHAAGRTINFLKIDVEGYEYEVLAGNDWLKYRPELLCIEANHVNHDWRPLVKKAGYILVFNDGLNEYYLRRESTQRKKNFDYADAMILSGIIVNPGVAEKIMTAEKLPIVEAQNITKDKEIGELRAHLEQYQSTKFLLRKLGRKLATKLLPWSR